MVGDVESDGGQEHGVAEERLKPGPVAPDLLARPRALAAAPCARAQELRPLIERPRGAAHDARHPRVALEGEALRVRPPPFGLGRTNSAIGKRVRGEK